MTPLIDVSLVLVVILMVATPLALQSSIAFSTAGASGRAAAKAERTERIELEVLSNESVRVNAAVVARADLSRTLAPLLAHSATRLVVVRCADGVSHGAFVGVLDDARMLGAARIAVVGR
jgi:biopolymer transport protein ExbD